MQPNELERIGSNARHVVDGVIGVDVVLCDARVNQEEVACVH